MWIRSPQEGEKKWDPGCKKKPTSLRSVLYVHIGYPFALYNPFNDTKLRCIAPEEDLEVKMLCIKFTIWMNINIYLDCYELLY